MNINEPSRGRGFILPFYKDKRSRRPGSKASSLKSNRLPFLNWVPDEARNHFVATSAEYAGTTLFLFFAFSGTQVALLSTPASSANEVGTPSHPDQLLFIALSFGFSLAVNAWVFFRISGGLFNPAVTLGMCLVGALPYIRGLFLFIAQVLGGITAAAIVSALFPGPLTVRTNLASGTSVVQGLFIEMFLSAELVFTIFMLAAEKHKGTFIAPVGIGLSLFVAELTGVYFTGGSVNPARSFGPSIVTHQFHSYHWIYWVGPILGSLLASGFYKFIKMLEYETANPGQDSSKKDSEHFNPDLDTSHSNVAFVPEEYVMSLRTITQGSEGHEMSGYGREGAMGNIGVPKEYGSETRPYSSSPSPPHPNDQFTDLAEGGMHGDESGSSSDRTLGGVGMQQIGSQEMRTQQMRAQRMRAQQADAQQIGMQSTGTTTMKPAMKKGTAPSGVPGKERSVRKNTQVNRNMNSGIPRDKEFYDKD